MYHYDTIVFIVVFRDGNDKMNAIKEVNYLTKYLDIPVAAVK